MACGTTSLEEALSLAAAGRNEHVDKLVRDIYGCESNSLGLPGDLLAASLGEYSIGDKIILYIE